MKSKAAVKLKNSSGETIVEVLASVLISSLAILLLFSTIMVSVRIVRTARESDEKYYQELNAAEAGEALNTGALSRIVILGDNNQKYEEKNAKIYSTADGLRSYRLTSTSGTNGGTNEETP